jgi:nucleotide-binding universal stress UspA family protein
MWSVQTILHPTDFSDPAQNSFQLACALASDLKARLIVLHVVPKLVAFRDDLVEYASPEHRVKVWEKLRRLRETAQEGYDLEIEIDQAQGAPAGEILKAARSNECDLVVMGTHGRSGLFYQPRETASDSAWPRPIACGFAGCRLVGNVAEQVIRRSPCPVITVSSPLSLKTSPKAVVRAENRALVSSF